MESANEDALDPRVFPSSSASSASASSMSPPFCLDIGLEDFSLLDGDKSTVVALVATVIALAVLLLEMVLGLGLGLGLLENMVLGMDLSEAIDLLEAIVFVL